MNRVVQPTCDSNLRGFCAGHQFSRESVPRSAPVAPLGVSLPRLVDQQIPRVQHRVRGNCVEKERNQIQNNKACISHKEHKSVESYIDPAVWKLEIRRLNKVKTRQSSNLFRGTPLETNIGYTSN
ncbi:hypothetical protein CEXT_593911 [Caerostris extrusa]|uniref:Uncharacterized protein n=1 Tax=Caerostris extrusa TaxID=172846 RepID=A0AAV4T0W3_CAEEX|nr:hypothetical protein CEXT_593911 [Caerostris extrusa]